MELNLIIHNIGAILSIVLLIALAIFSLSKSSRQTANVTMALMLLFVAVFYISHLFGTNMTDPNVSRNFFMGSLSIIWVGVFLTHCVLSVLSKVDRRRGFILFVYLVGAGLTLFYLINPNNFLLPSAPKLFLPNYYVPGAYHTLMRIIFNLVIPLYFLFELFENYRISDPVGKNRLKYFLFSIILGYGGGFGLVFLIYNIPVNPNWGIFFAFFFAIPFVYAATKYELLDIKIIAKRALVFGSLVAIVGIFFVFLGFTNDLLVGYNPSLPKWLLPGWTALLAVGVGGLVWKRLKEVEVLKYEFITVVTHKFRTPLTHIKWSAEALAQSDNPEDRKVAVEEILNSNRHLVELTNTLIGLSSAEGSSYLYKFEKVPPRQLIDKALEALTYRIKKKQLRLVINEGVCSRVLVDARRFDFALNIILENAVMYTPVGGQIEIGIRQDHKQVAISIRDSGVGIPKEELPKIFTKFYRGSKAKLIDTEGLGIGLFMAKKIVEDNGGGIEVVSGTEGSHRGTEFTIRLKAVR